MNGKEHLTETELIERCIRGEKKSQEALYRKYASKMYGVCLGYVNSRDDAKDVLQEAFIKVFESLKKFSGEGSFEGWIRRIVVNTAIDYYRKVLKEQKNIRIDEVFEVKSEISSLDKIHEKELLELIHRLPEGARIIFNLYVIEGYSHDEIAQILNISLSTSKSQFWRAKGLLQSWINQLNDPKPLVQSLPN
ncbi:MAG: RNA polymerase sigma factor [Bacteroidia bacterium]